MKEFNLEKAQQLFERTMFISLILIGVLIIPALIELQLFETNFVSWALGINIVFLMGVTLINFVLSMVQTYNYVTKLADELFKHLNNK